MIKKLSKVGGSQAVILDRGILELYGLSEEVEITPLPDGKGIAIRAPGSTTTRDEKFQNALKNTHRKFGRMYKNLS